MSALPLDRLRDALSGSYSIDRELGRGGMATVYLAQDAKHERLVALKVLHPDLAASLGPDRFLREIKLVARLKDELQVPLNVRSLYEHPTVAALAEHVAAVRWAAEADVATVAHEQQEEGVL